MSAYIIYSTHQYTIVKGGDIGGARGAQAHPTLVGEGAEHPQNTEPNSNTVNCSIIYKLNLAIHHKQHVSFRYVATA